MMAIGIILLKQKIFFRDSHSLVPVAMLRFEGNNPLCDITVSSAAEMQRVSTYYTREMNGVGILQLIFTYTLDLAETDVSFTTQKFTTSSGYEVD